MFSEGELALMTRRQDALLLNRTEFLAELAVKGLTESGPDYAAFANAFADRKLAAAALLTSAPTVPAAKPHKLTEAQRRVLTNLVNGRRWDEHLSGRSAYGGAISTMRSLQKHGYIKHGAITEEGRQALGPVLPSSLKPVVGA